jgi:hypothetical protein
VGRPSRGKQLRRFFAHGATQTTITQLSPLARPPLALAAHAAAAGDFAEAETPSGSWDPFQSSRAGQNEKAVAYLEKSLKDHPDWGGPLNWRALTMAEQRRGHAAQARKWLDRSRQFIAQKAHGTPNQAGASISPIGDGAIACKCNYCSKRPSRCSEQRATRVPAFTPRARRQKNEA